MLEWKAEFSKTLSPDAFPERGLFFSWEQLWAEAHSPGENSCALLAGCWQHNQLTAWHRSIMCKQDHNAGDWGEVNIKGNPGEGSGGRLLSEPQFES